MKGPSFLGLPSPKLPVEKGAPQALGVSQEVRSGTGRKPFVDPRRELTRISDK